MRPLATVILLIMSLAVPGCTMWKEKPPTKWSQATGGEQLERLLWQDLKAKNWTQVEQHLASNFVFLTPSGPLNRAAAIERLKRLQLADYFLGEFRIDPSGNDMIVTYSVVVRGTFDGQALPGSPFRMMTIWQKAKKGWMAIAHNGCPGQVAVASSR